MHLLEDFLTTELADLFFQLGKTILVPLTNSLYVPGKLSDPDHVIVDVGTGYYVQKVRCTKRILILL